MICAAVSLRFDQFLRLMRQVPAFDPRPSVNTSYPASDETDSTPSICRAICCNSVDLAEVRSSVEPGGV